jgi:ribosomal protein S18 acetylase RimI-like enzyme
MIAYRTVRLPEDRRALLQLDTSFTTDRIYRVHATAVSFTLLEEQVTPPIDKSFSLDDELGEDRLWEYGMVAEEQDTIVGFAAVRADEWNRRAAIWHLYVAPQRRGVGLGRQLIAHVEEYARAIQARCLWLETSNVNYPAIQFYRSIGFKLCGLDQTLYPPASAPGETALYFAREIVQEPA